MQMKIVFDQFNQCSPVPALPPRRLPRRLPRRAVGAVDQR